MPLQLRLRMPSLPCISVSPMVPSLCLHLLTSATKTAPLPFSPSVDEVSSYPLLDFGIQRLDHIVSSVPKIAPVVSYPKNFTRFHEFVEFTAEDVRTCESRSRVGCMLKDEEGKDYQKGGCGGFGKGNFSELFKSIKEYEKTLEAK
nr:4-hydroxyphenylpyruvate dioxygenase [Quercus suber]